MSVVPQRDGSKLCRTWPDVPSGEWHTIVIGSGMGGMSCAAALSRQGQRVLLLEQHFIPGGFTHVFARRDFEWDVGVHALGEMTAKEMPRRLLDWLTMNSVEMAPLGDPYDRFHFPDGFEVSFADNPHAFRSGLKRIFPEQASKIDAYFSLCKKAAKDARLFFVGKVFPAWMGSIGAGVLKPIRRNWWQTTTEQVFDELQIDGKLRCVLAAQWAYYGEVPRDSSFAMQALIHAHYRNGAFYPVGGSRSLADGLLSTIQQNGGQTMVRASVDQILVEGQRAVGVRMADGTELRSSHVVSAAGVKNTVNHLIPSELRESDWAKALRGLPDSPSYICLNLGFEGDLSPTEASAANRWIFQEWRDDQREWNPVAEPDAPPFYYLSFPSLKDPQHDPGPKLQNTGECISLVPWHLFEDWKDSQYGKRPADYQQFKQELKDRLLTDLRQRFPKVMGHLAYAELSTPLTTQHFAAASQGAIYGLASVPERYACKHLRLKTPLKRLLLTGVDVTTPGVISAMITGLLTASIIDRRLTRRLL